jgi:hypothetical protein
MEKARGSSVMFFGGQTANAICIFCILVPHFERKCSPSVIVNPFIFIFQEFHQTFQFSTFAGWNIVRLGTNQAGTFEVGYIETCPGIKEAT